MRSDLFWIGSLLTLSALFLTTSARLSLDSVMESPALEVSDEHLEAPRGYIPLKANEWDEIRIYGENIINGMRAESNVKNTTNCFNRIMNLTFIEGPGVQENLTIHSGDTKTQIESVTHLITNTSNHLWVCNDMLRNFYSYNDEKIQLFGGDLTDYFTGFFQNLLANVISINSIYQSVT